MTPGAQFINLISFQVRIRTSSILEGGRNCRMTVDDRSTHNLDPPPRERQRGGGVAFGTPVRPSLISPTNLPLAFPSPQTTWRW